MADVLRIKRRYTGGAAGAPTTLANGELAYNEVDDKLYYGKGNNAGQATSIIPIAGPGMGYSTGGGSSLVVTDDVAPALPSDGTLWFDTTSGQLYIYYSDANSSQWVPAFNIPAGSPTTPFLQLTGGQLSGPLAINRAIPAGGNAGTLYTSGSVITGNLGFNGYVNAAATSWLHLTGTGTGGTFYYDTSSNQFWWYTFPNAAAGAAVTLTPLMTLSSSVGLVVTASSVFVQPASGWAQVVANKPTAADAAAFVGQRAGVARWHIYMGNTAAEAGSNVGSDFSIDRFSDTGAYLGAALVINRAAGGVTFNQTAAFQGGLFCANNTGINSYTTVGASQTLIYLANNNQIYINPQAATVNISGHTVSGANNTYLLGNTGTAFSNVVAYGFTNASDVRDKEEITDLPPDCLSLVQTIQPKRYKFNNAREEDRDRMRWGFIAQEVGVIMQEAGHDFGGHYIGDDKKQSQALSYHDLMTVLWKAVQELSAEVAILKAAK